MEVLETTLHSLVNYSILLFEYIGVLVIAFSGIQGMVNYIRRSPDTRLCLAKGLAMGLEFKLGSEILRTVIVRNLKEIGIVAGIILLRAVLTILIHWEIKNEESDAKEEPVKEEPVKEVLVKETPEEQIQEKIQEPAIELEKQEIKLETESGFKAEEDPEIKLENNTEINPDAVIEE